jgi:hypothetical protein
MQWEGQVVFRGGKKERDLFTRALDADNHWIN